MEEVLLAIHSVEVVSEGANCEVSVVAELGVTHELRFGKLGDACHILAGGRLCLLRALSGLSG